CRGPSPPAACSRGLHHLADGDQLYTLVQEALPQAAEHGDGPGAVAVDADGVGLDGYPFAGDRLHPAFAYHGPDALRHYVGVVDDGTRQAAGEKPATGVVAAIGKGFAGDTGAHLTGDFFEAAAREDDDDQVGICLQGTFDDGPGGGFVIGGAVVESAVGFDVFDLGAVGAGEGLQSADLVGDEIPHFLRRHVHVTPSKPLQVGVGGVRADADALFGG